MKNSLVLLMLCILFLNIVFVYSLWVAYPVFQSTRFSNPLALLDSLPFSFYVSIILVVVLCFFTIRFSISRKYIHLLLLFTFSTILWATPYYLADFVRLPLGPWKIAQSIHIEEILGGAQMPFSWYGRDYPGSFVFNNVFLTVTGTDAISYIRWVFPFIQTLIVITLTYAFLLKIFNWQTAFLSVLVMIPGLHYIVLQPAPSSYGLILLLFSLFLITKRQRANEFAFAATFFLLVASHSVYSVLLLMAIAVLLIVQRIFGRFEIQVSGKLFAACLIWFLIWETTAVSPDRSLIFRLFSFASLSFWQNIFGGTQFLSQGGTVFSRVDTVGRLVYVFYFIAAIAAIGALVIASRKKSQSAKRFLGLAPICIWLLIDVFVFGFAGFALLMRTPDEAERVLFLFILFCSTLVAYESNATLTRVNQTGRIAKKLVLPVLLGLTLILACLYPFVAYSIDGYSNFPLSEHFGLKFLSNYTMPKTEILILGSESQYLFYTTNFTLVSGDSLMGARSPEALQNVMSRDLSSADIVALRGTAYFYLSIRVDRSFENNRFIEIQQRLESNLSNVIYSNPSFQVWAKSH